MMSANPHSGIHEAQVAKTLDTTVPTPQKAQGGQMIVERAASPNGVETSPGRDFSCMEETSTTLRVQHTKTEF